MYSAVESSESPLGPLHCTKQFHFWGSHTHNFGMNPEVFQFASQPEQPGLSSLNRLEVLTHYYNRTINNTEMEICIT